MPCMVTGRRGLLPVLVFVDDLLAISEQPQAILNDTHTY
jgi:hypothetical protein